MGDCSCMEGTNYSLGNILGKEEVVLPSSSLVGYL